MAPTAGEMPAVARDQGPSDETMQPAPAWPWVLYREPGAVADWILRNVDGPLIALCRLRDIRDTTLR